MSVVINKRKCPAQEAVCLAIPACPQGAISYQADETELMGGRIQIDAARCDGCSACVEDCCGQVIELQG